MASLMRSDPENALPYPKIMVDDRNPNNIILALHEVQQRSTKNIVILRHTDFPSGDMKGIHIASNFSDYDGIILDEWLQLMRPIIGFLDKFPHFKIYKSPEERDVIRRNDRSLYTPPKRKD